MPAERGSSVCWGWLVSAHLCCNDDDDDDDGFDDDGDEDNEDDYDDDDDGVGLYPPIFLYGWCGW